MQNSYSFIFLFLGPKLGVPMWQKSITWCLGSFGIFHTMLPSPATPAWNTVTQENSGPNLKLNEPNAVVSIDFSGLCIRCHLHVLSLLFHEVLHRWFDYSCRVSYFSKSSVSMNKYDDCGEHYLHFMDGELRNREVRRFTWGHTVRCKRHFNTACLLDSVV